MLLFRLTISVAILLLLTASITSHWQIIGIDQPPLNTNIGLWQICSKYPAKYSVCRSTRVDSSHKLILYLIRFLSILSIFVACGSIIFANNRSISIILIGSTLLLSFLTSFLYSSYLENYFSEYFDKLMYSRYSYSYYLQWTAILILLFATILRCMLS